MHITPEILEALYELLARTPPFKRWKLPSADEVGFSVSGSIDVRGSYRFDKGAHHIMISAPNHHTLRSAMETMAHEIVHLRENLLCVRGDVHHGRDFKRMADQVCRTHGFDRGQF